MPFHPVEARPETDLILNDDGSIYHLHLKPGMIARDIILVGDPARVTLVSSHFDTIEHDVSNREFRTITGAVNNKRISVISSGIGIDNIDIVINELDAVVNMDFETRVPKKEHTRLNLIRIGTSGALHRDIPVDSFLAASHGVGLDGLLYFYERNRKVVSGELTAAFITQVAWPGMLPRPYVVEAPGDLLSTLAADMPKGITATAPGFYAPQGREIRLDPSDPEINERLAKFKFKNLKVTNFEMETSALYGLAAMLGHQALTVCAIIANRPTQTFSEDYKKTVHSLVEEMIDRISKAP